MQGGKTWLGMFLLGSGTLATGWLAPLATARVIEERGEIPVTAEAPANQSSFQLELAPSKITLGPDEITDYQITYGSYRKVATEPLTLEVEWENGVTKTSNGRTRSVPNLLRYAPGRATAAYAATAPVVDLRRQKIVWTIASFPAQLTNEKVSFALRTPTTLNGEEKFSVRVRARLIGADVVLDDRIVTQTVESRPASQVSGPSPLISEVAVTTVTKTMIGLKVTTTRPTTLLVRYGSRPDDLRQILRFETRTTRHRVGVGNLTPNTTYYFALEATADDGATATSDLIMVQTAALSDAARIITGSLVVTSNGTVLVGPDGSADGTVEALTIVQGSTYELRITLENGDKVNSVWAFLEDAETAGADAQLTQFSGNTSEVVSLPRRQAGVHLGGERGKLYQSGNMRVLGVRRAAAAPSQAAVELMRMNVNTFQGSLVAPLASGEYAVVLQITDTAGNQTEQIVFTIHVTTPLVIVDAATRQSVEGARVGIERYDETNRTFQPLAANGQNAAPIYSKPDGTVAVTLSNGRYQATVHAISYHEARRIFTLGNGDGYPEIPLEAAPVTVGSVIRYYGQAALQIAQLTLGYFRDLIVSNRNFQLALRAILLTSLLLSLLAFSARTRIPLVALPFYLASRIRRWIGLNATASVSGFVYNHHLRPVAGADVYLIDADRHAILERGRTNRLGQFNLRRQPAQTYKIHVVAMGFPAQPLIEVTPEAIRAGDLHLFLQTDPQLSVPPIPLRLRATQFFLDIIGMSFEFWLMVTLLLATTALLVLGLERAGLVLALALVNLLVWLVYRDDAIRRLLRPD